MMLLQGSERLSGRLFVANGGGHCLCLMSYVRSFARVSGPLKFRSRTRAAEGQHTMKDADDLVDEMARVRLRRHEERIKQSPSTTVKETVADAFMPGSNSNWGYRPFRVENIKASTTPTKSKTVTSVKESQNVKLKPKENKPKPDYRGKDLTLAKELRQMIENPPPAQSTTATASPTKASELQAKPQQQTKEKENASKSKPSTTPTKPSGVQPLKPKRFRHDWEVAPSDNPNELEREETAANYFSKPISLQASVLRLDDMPNDNLPEVAFIGVSNVGKSSLLNAVAGRNSLAVVSQTPGRTRTLNFYRVGNNRWHYEGNSMMYLVDLPGYGSAEVSMKFLREWTQRASEYIFSRKKVCLLIDPFVGFRDVDIQALNLMDHYGKSYQIVLTKVDRLQPDAIDKAVKQIQDKLAHYQLVYPTIFTTSSVSKYGINALRVSLMEACEISLGRPRDDDFEVPQEYLDKHPDLAEYIQKQLDSNKNKKK